MPRLRTVAFIIFVVETGCFRDLDFAPCQEDPSLSICAARADSEVGDSTNNATDDSTIAADASTDSFDTEPADSGTTDSLSDAVMLDAETDGSLVPDSMSLDAALSDGSLDAFDAADTSSADGGCDAAACVTPPATDCKDGTTRRTYAASGTCVAGKCSYVATEASCPSATPYCLMGACGPQSCTGGGYGLDDCGGGAGESCCASLSVPAGTFKRNNSASTVGTVSAFRLDKYEVTVGRFRKFVSAVIAGYRPPAGSGKHAHLSGGGLSLVGGGTESGWSAAWNTSLPATKTSWEASTALGVAGGTWTSTATASDSKPSVGMNWYQAYAFCIWDGGFLPSNTEFEYASTAGSEQRKYPWGPTTPAADAKLAVYDCYYSPSPCVAAPVGSAQMGDGKWGQADLAGNVSEFVFDGFGSLPASCANCATPATGTDPNRFYRSGDFGAPATFMETSYFDGAPSSYSDNFLGFRCARTP